MKTSKLAYFLVFAILYLQSSPAESQLFDSGTHKIIKCVKDPLSCQSSSYDTVRTTTTTKKPKYIVNVKYHKDKEQFEKVEEVTLASSTAENCCPVDVRDRCTPTSGDEHIREMTKTSTKKWEFTKGRTVTRGLTFRAEIPIIKASFGREAKIEYSDSNQEIKGTTLTETVKFKHKLKVAVANPGLKKVCTQSTERRRVSIPFTMTWSDGATTEGFFKGQSWTNSINKCKNFAPKALNPEGNFNCDNWGKHLDEMKKKIIF